MNKSCILCNGKYNFDSILIKECLNETTIAFAGGSGKADNNNHFRYCPACGEKLTKEKISKENNPANQGGIRGIAVLERKLNKEEFFRHALKELCI